MKFARAAAVDDDNVLEVDANGARVRRKAYMVYAA